MQGPLRTSLSRLEQGLLAVPGQWPERPKAILVVSGHWEEAAFTITTSPSPGMVYDYFGFPREMYNIRYACPGSPGLALRVMALLSDAGLQTAGTATRGYDHGVYSILQTMVPSADIPVVQLSMRAGMDPDEHLRAGRALAPLRDDGILIIGSGMSCLERGPNMVVPSSGFDQWLSQTLETRDVMGRWHHLREWEKAPHAREVHPREDHLLPLMVAVGAAELDPGHCIYRDQLMDVVTVSSYRFSQ